jgi:hypothetical protein
VAKQNPVLDEAWRYLLSQQRIPRETVYHYTNEPALLNIIEKKQMWATDLRFMNDPEELTYGRELLEEALLEAARRERHEQRVRWLALMTGQMRELTRVSNWYSISVCQTADLASQWREYGYEGRGFVLGWSIDTLPPEVPLHVEVIYDRPRQIELARHLIEIHLRTLRPTKDLGHGRGKEAMLRAAGSLGILLNILLFNFKRDRWASENEIRYVYQGLNGQPPAGTIVKTRPAGDVAKPYVESDFSAVPLRVVIAGPSVENNAARNVRRALDLHGYRETPMYRSSAEL